MHPAAPCLDPTPPPRPATLPPQSGSGPHHLGARSATPARRLRPQAWASAWLWGFCGLAALATPTQAQTTTGLPQRNLMVEVRVIRAADVDESQPANTRPTPPGTELSTRGAVDDLPPSQQLSLINGQRGQFRYSRRMPVLWMQSASQQTGQGSTATSPAGGNQAGGRSSVSDQLTWLESGQALSVQAGWPGGRAPVRVDLTLDAATIEPALGQPMPAHRQRSASTSVITPMGRWTTFAAIGTAAAAESSGRKARALSTRDLSDTNDRQLWQVRVTVD